MEAKNDKIFTLIFYDTLSVTLQILSVLFNGAIICTLWKKSLLRYPSNRFVLSLCMSHFLVAILTIMISIVQPFIGRFSISSSSSSSSDDSSSSSNIKNMNENTIILSQIILFATFLVALGSLITITFISIDRFFTITKPMKYKTIVTAKKCTSAIIFSWLVALILSILPILTYDNEIEVIYGTFAIPFGKLSMYFGVVFSLVTLLALSSMTICYFRIFMIAKEKVQMKVQFGQFTSSPVSSISSDWPSSAYSSTNEIASQHHHKSAHSSSRVSAPNPLLHWVLMANLVGRHPQPLRMPYNLQEEKKDLNALQNHHNSSQTQHPHLPNQNSCPPQQHKKRWRKLLRSYNSPRKTIITIIALIGSVIILQIPLNCVLFSPLQTPQLFYFCYKVLFSFSSLTNPILYGLLNRTIRVQLWKVLKLENKRKKSNKTIVPGKVGLISRKGSISSGDYTLSPQFSRRQSFIRLPLNPNKINSIKDFNNELINNNNNNNDKNVKEFESQLLISGQNTDKINQTISQSPTEDENEHLKIKDENENESGENSSNSEKSQLIMPHPHITISLSVDEDEEDNHHQRDYCNKNGENSSKSHLLQLGANEEEEEEDADAEFLLKLKSSMNFARKPSQDSGADVTFSDSEEEEEVVSASKDENELNERDRIGRVNVSLLRLRELELLEADEEEGEGRLGTFASVPHLLQDEVNKSLSEPILNLNSSYSNERRRRRRSSFSDCDFDHYEFEL